MPITLGCSSCGKRFRARDESAGKRVKCPYCQAAVSVPSSEDAGRSAAPTETVPAAPPASPFLPPRSTAAEHSPAAEPGLFDIAGRPVSPPESSAWGTSPPPASEHGFDFPDAPSPVPPRPSPAPRPAPAPINLDEPTLPSPVRAVRGRPEREDREERPTRAAEPARSPEEIAAAGWRRVSRGLCWVLFGLFFLALPGFAEFGKLVYERASKNELPRGTGWVKLNGYINDPNDKDSIQLGKREELNVLIYGAPLLIGGLMIIIGRLGCAAAPKVTGGGGAFLLSGLFTLIAMVLLATYLLAVKMGFYELRGYTGAGAMVSGGLAELWFLLGLGAVAGVLKRPRAVRAVGFYILVLGLAVLFLVDGGAWDVYRRYAQPKPRSNDWILLEEGLRMLGWLLVVGIAWRTVRATRAAVREWLDQYNEDHPGAVA